MTDVRPRVRLSSDRPRLGRVRYAVVASPNYPKSRLVQAFIHALPYGAGVVCGTPGLAGALITAAAKSRGLKISTIVPGTRHPSFPSGVREFDLVDIVDVVVAFWDGECRRTGAVVDRAMSRERRLWIADANGRWTFHCEPEQRMHPVSPREP